LCASKNSKILVSLAGVAEQMDVGLR